MIRFFWNTCKSFISLIYILCILVFLNVLDTKIPLEASVINVDLNPKTPGFKDFFKGRAHFEEGNWNPTPNFQNRFPILQHTEMASPLPPIGLRIF